MTPAEPVVHTVEGSQQPLRVGLLLDSFVKARWIARVIDDVRTAPFAEIVLIILERGRRPGQQRGMHRLLAERRYLLYRLYRRLDGALSRGRPDPFERVDVTPLVAGCPVIEVTPRRTTHSDRFEPADLEEIRTHRLDVALRFGFRILRGEALKIARHGVWSYHHGDGDRYRGGPPGFWEVMEGSPVTGCQLQVLDEELDAGPILCRSWAATQRRSVARNMRHTFWKSTAFVARELQTLWEQGSMRAADPGSERPRPYGHRLYRNPGNLELLPLLLRYAWRAAASRATEALTREQWFLAYRFGNGGLAHPAFRSFRVLEPPRARYWADPFPLARDGGHFLFFEDFDCHTRRGRISALELDPAGVHGPATAVLDRGYHLSYPCVFEWRGQVFMVPETLREGRVELYRSSAFPGEWQREAVLLVDLHAADPTLAEIDGRWWLFATVWREGMANANDELFLFHAERPTGPWRPHRRNPVRSDARAARPAGRLFRLGGHLYRPAQDCTNGYGSAIVLHRIERLTESEYSETEVARIEPRWRPGLRGNHTLNAAGELVVIDGLRRRGRLPLPTRGSADGQ